MAKQQGKQNMHAKELINQSHLPAIRRLLEDYFDGLYQGDTELLARVFHPEARYVTVAGEQWTNLGMAEYFQRVIHRPIPAEQGQTRYDQVLSIDLVGPNAAVAKVICAFNGRIFTDILSLVKQQSRWQVIHKLFHSELFDGDLLDSEPQHALNG